MLAAQAPDLTAALDGVVTDGWSHVVVDGKVVVTDRLTSTKASTKGSSSTPGTPERPQASAAATSKL